MFLRLRQLCLVAYDLEAVVEDLGAVFDLAVCHRDPAVARFGLQNALLAIGTSFIEIVAPIQPGTAAERYLERRHGDGGYMVILDTDEPGWWREHVNATGVRLAAALETDDYQGLQLHPRDTGGALMEINRTRGGSGLEGAYHPAGPDWQSYVRTGTARAIVGAELQSDEPARLAGRWGEVLQSPIDPADRGYQLALDNGRLRFVPARDGRGEGLSGIDIAVAGPETVCARARQRGLSVSGGSVVIGGVRFHLAAQG